MHWHAVAAASDGAAKRVAVTVYVAVGVRTDTATSTAILRPAAARATVGGAVCRRNGDLQLTHAAAVDDRLAVSAAESQNSHRPARPATSVDAQRWRCNCRIGVRLLFSGTVVGF